MHDTVVSLSAGNATVGEAVPAQKYTAAVSARKSLASRDHIISMIDGKPYKTLRRHLATNGMTPDEYRTRYGLKANYPMVAPTYSESRSAMAKTIGLGRKPGQATPSKADAKPARKGKATEPND
jgi:predicted transcriptional regulator